MEKKQIRALFKKKREALTEIQKNKQSLMIFRNAVEQFDLTGKKISMFFPISRFSEIDTSYFLDRLSATFYLPVIKGNNQLVHIKYEDKEQLKVSDWGIPEPTYGDEIEESKLDLVFVPLLAIDKKGFRVGYGKGFYDRFLAKCNDKCVFIGLNYFDLIEEISDKDQFDIPLDYCIMPNKIVKF